MRLNKHIAHYYGVSRREADLLISGGKVTIDGEIAILGAMIEDNQNLKIEGLEKVSENYVYLMLNKPVGYVCSRASQGDSSTVYDLLPKNYKNLKTVGRLDKDSSGLIMLTNDGDFTQSMTHPKNQKKKVYLVTLDRLIKESDLDKLNSGVDLKDGQSALKTELIAENKYKVSMKEGRNRQIRRTFGELDYTVIKLKRVEFGDYILGDLPEGEFKEVALVK